MRKMIVLAALLPAISVWAGDLTVDNLTVSSNAAIYGKVDIISVASGGSTNGATATGGTITTNGNYRIHTFTNSGTFEVSGGSLNCDVLVVAGGGGGGSAVVGAGGGGGGVIIASTNASGNYFVVVGNGGAGAWGGSASVTNAIKGENSSFGNYEAIGGGEGGNTFIEHVDGGDGGSGGGGGGGDPSPSSGGSGTDGQGNAGGTGQIVPYTGYAGGGGGGASEVGENSSGMDAGDGGNGVACSYSGSVKYYGGGGGGAWVATYGSYGVGGNGGGGDGAHFTPWVVTDGLNGEDGTGGGGGGGATASADPARGGKGGSGIVIVRYAIGSSGTNTMLSISSNGINQISASGTNVFMSKVGIGTNSPAEQLHVVGNVRVDGTNIVSAIKLGNEEPRTTWPTGNLSASNNLSDITNSAAARANLGLGSAATNNADAFLAPNGDGSQLTGITAAQVDALSTTGGVVNGSLTIIGSLTVNNLLLLAAPYGDLTMGGFTNSGQ